MRTGIIYCFGGFYPFASQGRKFTKMWRGIRSFIIFLKRIYRGCVFQNLWKGVTLLFFNFVNENYQKGYFSKPHWENI
jgi:hypothetical protein